MKPSPPSTTLADLMGAMFRENDLSVTGNRKAILQAFLESKSALSHANLEKLTGGKFDRASIYRTLQTFIDKGIIHTIPTPDNTILYALCKNHCTHGRHLDDHVHFLCVDCNHTYCLEEVKVPAISLPKGFVTSQTDVIINGVCENCKAPRHNRKKAISTPGRAAHSA